MDYQNNISYNTIRFSHTNYNHFAEREMHTYHELLYCIGGDVSVYTEGFYRSVKRGTLMLIPRGCYHLFQIHGETPFERLWVGFSEGDLPCELALKDWNGIRMIEAPNATLRLLLGVLCDAADEGGALAAVRAYGALITLLCTLPEHARAAQGEGERPLIRHCLSYIEANLSDKLSVAQIAARLYVSHSTLSHCFQREMGISLYRYVTQKRLLLACEQIERGMAPTAACSACGWADYSSFYRAYVKAFGRSPGTKT